MHTSTFTHNFIALLLSLTFFAANSCSTYAQNNRVPVGTVNGETLWLKDVMKQAERLPAEFRKAPIANYFDQLVADMVDARIAANEARLAKHDLREDVATAMKIAADRVLAESWLGDKVSLNVTDEAIQKAYQTFSADTASREQVTAAHILVETESEAKEIILSLEGGADFTELAKSKSTGPSGPNGGSLGKFSRGQMVPAFENAAFNLGAGEITKNPVQTQFGWHVIKVSEKAVKPAPSFDAMRDQLVNSLSRQHLGRVIESLRADQTIELRSFEDVRIEVQAKAQ